MTEYIYIGKFFHRKKNELDLSEKKIGRTTNLKVREYGLNRTKAPIGYIMIAAWCTDDDTDMVEKQLHALLRHNHSYGEWFEDDDNDLVERVGEFMMHGEYAPASLSIEDDDVANEVRKEEQENLKKREVRKKHFDILVGKEFSYNPAGKPVAIRIDATDKFFCPGTNKFYNGTLHAAFKSAARELTNDPKLRGRNVWKIPKDANGKSMDDLLTAHAQQVQK